jgi:Yip1 domain
MPPVSPAESATPASTSIWAKLFNIFAVPGDVFTEVRAAPASVANWLVPVLISVAVGVATCFIIFSQPNIQQQLREQQAKAMDQQVKAGKMTQAQADQALAISEKFMGPTMMKLFGSVSVVVMSFVRVIWWAFLLWLFGRWFLKAQLAFTKTLEVAGLAMLITALGGVVALLLQMNLDRLFVTPSASLMLKDFDMTKKTHWLLSVVNPFYFWQVGLMAFGLARLAGKSFWRAAVPVTVYWVLQECALVAGGMGQLAM